MLFRTSMYMTYLLISVLSVGIAKADEVVLPVFGESWFVTVDIPSLDELQCRKEKAGFQCLATSAKGFHISYFVEEPKVANGSHEECQKFYWAKMKRNPLIDSDTVKTQVTDRYVKVSYEMKGLPAKAPKTHVNYFIAHGGKWLDFHLSISPDLDATEIFDTFEKSLRFQSYKQTPSSDSAKVDGNQGSK